MAGFSLHAGVAARADQRQKLERLCRYISRPAISEKRLSVTPNDNVRYQLKTPYRDGTTHVIFEPPDFISRLAALVPKPRVNLTRFHGGFALNSTPRSVQSLRLNDRFEKSGRGTSAGILVRNLFFAACCTAQPRGPLCACCCRLFRDREGPLAGSRGSQIFPKAAGGWMFGEGQLCGTYPQRQPPAISGRLLFVVVVCFWPVPP